MVISRLRPSRTIRTTFRRPRKPPTDRVQREQMAQLRPPTLTDGLLTVSYQPGPLALAWPADAPAGNGSCDGRRWLGSSLLPALTDGRLVNEKKSPAVRCIVCLRCRQRLHHARCKSPQGRSGRLCEGTR